MRRWKVLTHEKSTKNWLDTRIKTYEEIENVFVSLKTKKGAEQR